MHSFEVHSNESSCRKKVCFGLEQVITVHIDNVGSIFLSDNISVSQQMKQIDVRHRFIREYVEDGTVKIQFFCSQGKLIYPFTNNLSNGLL